MCKTQRDIEVAQQDERKKNKKMMDTMKALHNQSGYQPPRSPISPSPPEVEIPSVDDRVMLFSTPIFTISMGATLDQILVHLPPQLLLLHPLLALIRCLKVTLLPHLHGFLLHRLMSGSHVSHMNSLISLPLPMVWKIHSCLYF
jgi:hypothetical protein